MGKINKTAVLMLAFVLISVGMVSVVSAKPKKLSPIAPTPIQTVQTGTLDLSSSPSGALVYFDGELKGTTHLVISASPGWHDLQLLLGPYKWGVCVLITAGETIFLDVDFGGFQSSHISDL